MTMLVSSRYLSMARASERFALGLLLRGALGHEVVGRLRPVQKELVPGVADRGNDAVHAARPHLHFFDAFGQAYVSRQAHGLRTVVGENGGDAHGDLQVGYAMSIWCRSAMRHQCPNRACTPTLRLG